MLPLDDDNGGEETDMIRVNCGVLKIKRCFAFLILRICSFWRVIMKFLLYSYVQKRCICHLFRSFIVIESLLIFLVTFLF